jgi:C4-dicarboxylate-specific signal transduction histidine kinase
VEKSDETKGKTERKERNTEDIHGLTKQEREIQKKLRTFAKEEKKERSKSGM